MLHRLVAAAFLGPCPDGKQVNHIDGVKANGAAANLEYVTPRENILHAIRTGLMTIPPTGPRVRGGDHYRAKVTEGQVREMRRRYAGGTITFVQLGAEHGLSYQCVKSIVRGITWSHLPGAIPVPGGARRAPRKSTQNR